MSNFSNGTQVWFLDGQLSSEFVPMLGTVKSSSCIDATETYYNIMTEDGMHHIGESMVFSRKPMLIEREDEFGKFKYWGMPNISMRVEFWDSQPFDAPSRNGIIVHVSPMSNYTEAVYEICGDDDKVYHIAESIIINVITK